MAIAPSWTRVCGSLEPASSQDANIDSGISAIIVPPAPRELLLANRQIAYSANGQRLDRSLSRKRLRYVTGILPSRTQFSADQQNASGSTNGRDTEAPA